MYGDLAHTGIGATIMTVAAILIGGGTALVRLARRLRR